MTTNGSEIPHHELVKNLVKPPEDILASLNPFQTDLLHALIGICSEVGELGDPIKAHVFYGKPLDVENIIEELGDMEFYMEQLRQRLVINRQQTIDHNIAKLSKRYSSLKYSDNAAIRREDKIVE